MNSDTTESVKKLPETRSIDWITKAHEAYAVSDYDAANFCVRMAQAIALETIARDVDDLSACTGYGEDGPALKVVRGA